MIRGVLLWMAFLLCSGVAGAETLYVTDRILLGVHQQPQEDSILLQSVVSGTAVEVIGSQGAFSKIRLLDGTEGWVSSGFLKKEKPAIAEVDEVYKKFTESDKALKAVSEELARKERELQVRRDELSNARNSIKDLNAKLAAGTGGEPVVDDTQLQAAQQKIDELTAQVQALTAAQQAAEAELAAGDDVDVAALRRENQNLRARIESARANLSGETIPSPEQLAALRPEFPLWYWGLLFLMLLLGVIGGLIWMDYRNRMRHGGFRI
ncbi:MAG: TIGR04211 family SH3 domain-containing protein [Gammaproteobacteria bacterium]